MLGVSDWFCGCKFGSTKRAQLRKEADDFNFDLEEKRTARVCVWLLPALRLSVPLQTKGMVFGWVVQGRGGVILAIETACPSAFRPKASANLIVPVKSCWLVLDRVSLKGQSLPLVHFFGPVLVRVTLTLSVMQRRARRLIFDWVLVSVVLISWWAEVQICKLFCLADRG